MYYSLFVINYFSLFFISAMWLLNYEDGLTFNQQFGFATMNWSEKIAYIILNIVKFPFEDLLQKINIDFIGNILNANSWILTTIYRLPKSLVKLVSIFMPSMGILSSKTDNTKKDITPNLTKGSSKEKEVEYIISNAETKLAIGENAVIILPGHDSVVEFVNIALSQADKNIWDPEDPKNKNKWEKTDFGSLNRHLRNNNINIEYIGNSYGDLYNNGNTDKIIVMTYHSSKGLDFDNVYLPFMGTHYDKAMYYFNDTLFMVGMTRSKLSLTITYSGSMNNYTTRIENNCNKIDIDNIMSRSVSDFDDDFDF